jgi:ATP-dependent exoDNAse (exonuclease V) beta subunit
MGDQKKEDEELRVCYVGITRSKKDLYLLELPGEYKNPFPPLQTYLGEKYDG